MSKTLPRVFTRVKIPNRKFPNSVDADIVVPVVDHLSTQFTVELPDGKIEFLFYVDRLLTWELVK